ncbi:endolysin [Mycobacterium phage Saguaro]|uniref:N-acetylmuramoyl-L-alanine amidase n=1 Tax=Mycobacterium phage Saguaro TaxID=2315616 RepID=A0A386KB78_9CAUD|nr:endolysin [Mycobacterium phage Saguaro]AYD82042.1 lysin A [Mycobacterium phage Saguaro]
MGGVGWVWKAERPLLSQEEIARRVHQVSLKRGLDELATVLALMCIRQESDFWCPANQADPSSFNYPHDSESNDGRSVAYYQQQNGVAGETAPPGQDWWGPMSCRMNLECSTNTFLERLSDSYVTARDGAAAGRFIQNVQRSAFPHAYAKHWDYCWQLLDRALASGVTEPPTQPSPTLPAPVEPTPGIRPDPNWRGDPTFLLDLLRAWGVDVYEAEGARQRGHGDFGRISWVLWHHTGNRNETERGITHHPSLGLAANLLVFPDGRTCITGYGIAWHGGVGIYPGIPENGINQVSIGIECAHSGRSGDPWPTGQMEAMLRIGAAIKWFLGLPTGNQIAHKEWAGAENPLGINKQGKPDPVDIDMAWFRGEIARRAEAGPGAAGEDSWMSDPDVRQMIAEIYRETVTQKSPSRSFMAVDGALVDTPLGIDWNIDGNVWNIQTSLEYLCDVPYAVEVVETIAEHGVYEGTYAAGRQWNSERGQAYCRGLVALKAQLYAALAALAGPTGALTEAPAKKRAPARKRAPRKANQ